ncbi:DUF2752 domain-containing protein [Flavobacterium sp. CYK-55]|uniref:DUF2752 domain-containing protein n=1 Tax=Flavobacterium sp. CYK-55 TaxID=2835529 RepID=UPI001BCF70C8|nr:DUF2752 domain-containing protein [Flavobacterium sp. CYK-55]MBS7785789.1 DUF2752 domain-containing protein [Flavobacterium sp. CYK-55]
MLRRIVFYTRVIVTIIAPLVLLLLPVTFFDTGESICLSKMLANTECYACGMTKATMHFIHFDFQKAWDYNKLSYIVVPLLFPLWLKAVYEIQGKSLPGVLGKLT